MSRITVDLEKFENTGAAKPAEVKTAAAAGASAKKKSGLFGRILKIFLVVLAVVLVAGAIGGYFYWQELRRSPAYSLALVVDAARRDDKAALAKLVDTDRIVDAFVPQITDKAVELYGRGVPQAVLQRLARIASPILPALKDHARTELPRLIRDKTKAAESAPFIMVAIGAYHSLDVQIDGNFATVKSTLPDHPLELKMEKKGDVWQVMEIRDEPLARRIAEQVGQEIIGAAKGSVNKAGESLGVPNLNELLKKAEQYIR